MSDDLTIAYQLGVEDMRSRLHKQADEIERLRAENEKLREQIAAADLDNIRINYENEKLREALRPFAYYASIIPDDISDTCSASGTVGDLRDAAAAIRERGE